MSLIFYPEVIVSILSSVDTTECKNTIKWNFTKNVQGSNDYEVA